jgi:hypothetical protein
MAAQARSRGGLTVGSGRRRRQQARRRRVLAGAGVTTMGMYGRRRPRACASAGDLGHVRARRHRPGAGGGELGQGVAGAAALLRWGGWRRAAAVRTGGGGQNGRQRDLAMVGIGRGRLGMTGGAHCHREREKTRDQI